MYHTSSSRQGNLLSGAMARRLSRISSILAALPASPVFRTVVPLLILALFYWALFMNPGGVRGSSLTSEEARVLVDRSRQLFREEKYEEALGPVLKLYRAYPDSHIYAEQVARIFHKLHRYKEEAELWEEFRENAPRPEEACPHIGQAYDALGSPKEAISGYEWCLAQDPNNADSIFYLAHAVERDRQYDRAGDLYRRGLSLAPNYSDLSIGLARVLLHQGRVAEAKAAISDVLQRQPKNSDALYIMGMIFFRTDDFTQARRYLESGAFQADSDPDFHIALAQLSEKENNIPDAIMHYNRAVELSPEDKELRARRDSLVARH